MEIILIGLIIVFIVSYRTKKGESVYKFISEQAVNTYKKIEPYSFKIMREKVKELGLEYTPRQYLFQILAFAGLSGGISYLYFYNIFISVIYILIAVSFIPYVTYLRCKRQYSEYLFEQVQVYWKNLWYLMLRQ